MLLEEVMYRFEQKTRLPVTCMNKPLQTMNIYQYDIHLKHA